MPGPVDTLGGLARLIEESLGGDASAPDAEIAGVEAELRAAVTTLRLLVEGMNDGIVDATRGSQDAGELLSQVRRLSDLVERLGDPPDEDASTHRLLSIASLLGHWVTAMGPGAVRAGVTLHLDAAPDLPLVRANARDLSRVVLTVIHDAIQHTPPSEVVHVRVGAGPDGVLVRVEDVRSALPVAGPGLPPARAIVEAHGGRLWVEDSLAGGSVCFSLPAPAEEA